MGQNGRSLLSRRGKISWYSCFLGSIHACRHTCATCLSWLLNVGIWLREHTYAWLLFSIWFCAKSGRGSDCSSFNSAIVMIIAIQISRWLFVDPSFSPSHGCRMRRCSMVRSLPRCFPSSLGWFSRALLLQVVWWACRPQSISLTNTNLLYCFRLDSRCSWELIFCSCCWARPLRSLFRWMKLARVRRLHLLNMAFSIAA